MLHDMFSKIFGCHCVGENESNTKEYTWNYNSMNQAVRRMQYAVRGQIVMRADSLAAEGREIFYTNIGNPQAVGQKPNTYNRQVMALCDLPREYGIDNAEIRNIFPNDVIERAQLILSQIGPCGTGAYSNSQGILGIRQNVAKFTHYATLIYRS